MLLAARKQTLILHLIKAEDLLKTPTNLVSIFLREFHRTVDVERRFTSDFFVALTDSILPSGFSERQEEFRIFLGKTYYGHLPSALLYMQNATLIFVEFNSQCYFKFSDCMIYETVTTQLSLSLFSNREFNFKIVLFSMYRQHKGINPKSIMSSTSLDFAFVRLLLERLNSTAGHYLDYTSYSLPTVIINCDITYNNRYFNQPEYSFSSNTVSPLTCYSPPVLSYEIYIQPFDLSTWSLIVFVGILLCVLLKIYIHYYNIHVPNFSMFLLYIGSLTDEVISLPKPIRKILWIRLIVVFWFFESLLILSLYTSELISNLNAPPKGDRLMNLTQLFCNPVDPETSHLSEFGHRWEKIIQLFRSHKELVPWRVEKILSSLYEFYQLKRFLDYYEKGFNFRYIQAIVFESSHNKDCFAFLSAPDAVEYPKNVTHFIPGPFAYKLVWKAWNEETANSFEDFRNPIDNSLTRLYMIASFTSLDTRHSPLPLPYTVPETTSLTSYIEAAIENELLQCKKAIYFTENVDTDLAYLNTNYKRHTFYKLQENLYSEYLTWGFKYLGSGKLLLTVKRLVEGGVHGKMKKENLSVQYFKRRISTGIVMTHWDYEEFSAVTLGSSIQSIFIIYLCLSAFAIFTLGCEKCLSLRHKLAYFMIFVGLKFRKAMAFSCKGKRVKKHGIKAYVVDAAYKE